MVVTFWGGGVTLGFRFQGIGVEEKPAWGLAFEVFVWGLEEEFVFIYFGFYFFC